MQNWQKGTIKSTFNLPNQLNDLRNAPRKQETAISESDCAFDYRTEVYSIQRMGAFFFFP